MELLKGLYAEDETITLPCGFTGKYISCMDNCPKGIKTYKEVDKCYSEFKKGN